MTAYTMLDRNGKLFFSDYQQPKYYCGQVTLDILLAKELGRWSLGNLCTARLAAAMTDQRIHLIGFKPRH
jgi:hypothetical protein